MIAMDHRLALVLFVLLLLSAAAPIVCGWLILVPEEREPFAKSGESVTKKRHDAFAIFLLTNISLSLLFRIPGLDPTAFFSRLGRFLPGNRGDDAAMILLIWFGFVPGLAAAYAAVRPNSLRWPLITGGVLTLVLWFVSRHLLASIGGAI